MVRMTSSDKSRFLATNSDKTRKLVRAANCGRLSRAGEFPVVAQISLNALQFFYAKVSRLT